MIEVNLLPGGRSQKRRGGAGAGVTLAIIVDVLRKAFTDPWLAVAVGGVLLGSVTTGAMAVLQQRSAGELAALVEQTRSDSARYAEIVNQIQSAEARRDSVLGQMSVIAAVDGQRFVWAHVLDEISRALPTYTWLRSIAPSGAAASLSADQIAANGPPTLGIRVIGVTVNIQALTQFMKALEDSPFLADVTLAVSAVATVEGKEVTEFTLDMNFERPDAALLQTVPLPLSVP